MESAAPAKSTWTEWSTTRSTGTSGSMILGFLPSLATAVRMAARSTSSGTPVKSWSTMRATTNGISAVRASVGFQLASSRTLDSWTFSPSQFRSTDSRTSRIDTGSRGSAPHRPPPGRAANHTALFAVSEVESLEGVEELMRGAHARTEISRNAKFGGEPWGMRENASRSPAVCGCVGRSL